MWSRIRDIGVNLGKAGDELAAGFSRRALRKNYLPWLIEYLDGLGRENIAYAVSNRITLWEIIPEEWRRKALGDRGPLSRLGDRIDPQEAGDMIFEALVEERQDYGTIVTREWFVRSLDDYRRSRRGGT